MGLLGFWLFHPLPGSAWADGKLAELAEQIVEHPKSESTQLRFARRCVTLYMSDVCGRNSTAGVEFPAVAASALPYSCNIHTEHMNSETVECHGGGGGNGNSGSSVLMFPFSLAKEEGANVLVSVLIVGLSYGARNVLSYTRCMMQNFLAFRDSPIIPLGRSP